MVMKRARTEERVLEGGIYTWEMPVMVAGAGIVAVSCTPLSDPLHCSFFSIAAFRRPVAGKRRTILHVSIVIKDVSTTE